jgi:hypothetical protein
MSIELLDINHRDAIIDAFDKAKRQIRINASITRIM